jgi:phosphopantothenoylcysteine decarboxylase/phosphopantothenate--cysteine ligase
VRFIGNRSSGKQGYAMARVLAQRGADVTLIAGNTAGLVDPAGVDVERIGSAAQLKDAVSKHVPDAHVLVMAAAVADFRPARTADHKIKKRTDGAVEPLVLEANPDILAELAGSRRRPGQVVVGFAAETGDATGSVLDHGRAKLSRKGCDLLVVNEVGVGRTFGLDTTSAVILDRDGGEQDVPEGSKHALAHAVWDAVTLRLGVPGAPAPSR